MKLTGAVDARAIVPVRDAHGGVTIYYRARPTHYLLGGEWYHALEGPSSFGAAAGQETTGDALARLTTRFWRVRCQGPGQSLGTNGPTRGRRCQTKMPGPRPR